MIDTLNSGTDFIKELRLRRWARQNYVSPQLRSPEWHGIVLDEMRQRDLELLNRSTGSLSSAFVPLPPTDLRRYDEAHEGVAEPNLLNAPVRELVDY